MVFKTPRFMTALGQGWVKQVLGHGLGPLIGIGIGKTGITGVRLMSVLPHPPPCMPWPYIGMGIWIDQWCVPRGGDGYASASSLHSMRHVHSTIATDQNAWVCSLSLYHAHVSPPPPPQYCMFGLSLTLFFLGDFKTRHMQLH